jgi:hypothetical protein
MCEEAHPRLRAHLVLHGSIVLFLGLFAGGPYNMALTRSWGSGAVSAWVLAHSAGVLCGVMALSVGAVMPLLRLGRSAALLMVWFFVVSVYAFTIGMWSAAILSVRGILRGRSTADLVVNLFYTTGAWGALAGAVVLIYAAAATLRSIPRRSPQSATTQVSTMVMKNDM